MLNLLKLVLITGIAILSSQVFAAPNGVKASHLEELVIWKVSDELHLKPSEERAFAETIKKINLEKSALSDQLQKDISALKDEKAEKNLQKILKSHRKNVAAYAKLNEKEFDQVLKILGSEKMARYLILKQDITQKIKSMLSSQEAKPRKEPLPPPKIIE